MSIVFAGLAPHPPLLIPEIGRSERDLISLTDQGLTKLAGLMLNSEPDLLIVISPHGSVFSDAIAILHKPVLLGNFGQFGAPQVSLEEKIDLQFASELEKAAENRGIMVALLNEKKIRQYRIDGNLDHGIMVPLHYLRKIGLETSLVPITIGMLPYEDLYFFGTLIGKVSKRLGKKVGVIASGDLSHRLTPSAPAGYNPHGQEFDEFLVKALKKYEIEKLFAVDSKLIEKAGECGLRPLILMLGALDGLKIKSEVISYEGPFGVGYCVAAFQPTGEEMPSMIDQLYQNRLARIKGIHEREHILVQLARQTITNHVCGRQVVFSEELTSELKERRGVFVSIKKHGQLRGCIGTIEPTQKNLAEEIKQNAISAATRDPRFFPIEQDELTDLIISVDVLGKPEPIKSPLELDPVKYGVIVKQGRKSGLLLPDLEGIDTVTEQVEIAKQKAGISSNQELQLFRFEVKRYE